MRTSVVPWRISGSRLVAAYQVYPEGNSILKELIQNADDAGARVVRRISSLCWRAGDCSADPFLSALQVRFCFDRRSHGTASLAYSKMSDFQGPAIYAYNDAEFSAKDFESIQHIGGSKKTEAEALGLKQHLSQPGLQTNPDAKKVGHKIQQKPKYIRKLLEKAEEKKVVS